MTTKYPLLSLDRPDTVTDALNAVEVLESGEQITNMEIAGEGNEFGDSSYDRSPNIDRQAI